MRRPTLLDLYCKAGGAGMGYYRAGFEVTGVDVEYQRRYPFRFVQADALDYLREHGAEYDAIHASPPCQMFSQATFSRPHAGHRDLVTPTLELLRAVGRPWVVENVMRAPLGPWSCVLCGLMFGLKVFRHRKFDSSHLLLSQPHPSHKGHRVGVNGMVSVAGHGDTGRRNRVMVPPDHRNKASWERAMRIDWMTRNELAQAIPPDYTEYVGRQLRLAVRQVGTAARGEGV